VPPAVGFPSGRVQLASLTDRPLAVHALEEAWTRFWRDRNLKFLLYDTIGPTESIEQLLDEIDTDPMGILWG
jgi:hypothetical protein